MIKVGISGKIASGKSKVENILQELGYLVFDLDLIAHDLLEKEKIKSLISKEFKTTDRKELASIVFNDINQKKKLENIIHPEIKNIILEIFKKYQKEELVFISGALLFKSGFDKLFDKTIYVDCDENIRLQRLMKRNNLDEIQAKKRLNLQDDGNGADFIIKNNSDLASLKNNVLKTIKKLSLQ